MKQLPLLALLLFPFCALSQQSQLIPYRKGDKYGYSKPSGKLVIPPAFEYADFFFHKRAAVRIAVDDEKAYPGGYATIYINPKGKTAIKDTFEFGGNFHKELVKDKNSDYKETYIAQVNKNNERYLINENGERVDPSHIMEDAPVPEIYLLAEDQLEEVKKEPIEVFTKEDKWGIRKGEQVMVPAEFDFVDPIESARGIYVAMKGEKRAVLNLNTQQPLQWYSGLRTLGQVAANEKERTHYFITIDTAGRHGIINENSKVLLHNTYDFIDVLKGKSGIAVISLEEPTASKGKIDGLFDVISQTLIDPKYEYISTTVLEGIYRMEYRTKNRGVIEFYIDSTGREFYSE